MPTGNVIIDGIALGLGAIGDYNKQKGQHNAIQDAIDILMETQDYADQMRAQGSDIAKRGLTATTDIFGSPEQAKTALYDAILGINDTDPYKAGEFTYGKTIEDFYNPAFQLSVDAANEGINGSQALGGNLFSSDTANKISAQNQVLASGMYKDALEAMQADKRLEQSIWSGNENARQQEATSAMNLARANYDVASDTAGNLSSAQNAFYNALMGLNNDFWQNKTDYQAQLAALKAQDPGKAKFLGLFSEAVNGFIQRIQRSRSRAGRRKHLATEKAEREGTP